jgi:hypothetical protein
MKRVLKWVAIAIVLALAATGAAFISVFLLMRYGLLNVRGSISERNAFFAAASTAAPAAALASESACADAQRAECGWNETPEWEVVKGGLQKDAALLARVSRETGVSARMIAAVVVPEQTRFFTSNREVFKRYFEPLKILGSLSQFSLGVSGIKQETAEKIEEYANDPGSPFYPGPGMRELIAYGDGADHDAELFARLTDAKDHYYSLLYTALFVKEIEEQWKRAGFDISNNPEAVATLFNIGFKASSPNAHPRAAGAIIETGGRVYSYGALGGLFYRSDELADALPE